MTTIVAPTHSFRGRRGMPLAEVGGALANGIAIANLGVEERVKQVRREVCAAIDCRDHEYAALNQRKVVALKRENHQPAYARIGKDCLDNDDPADQPSDVDRKYGNRRKKGISQRMTKDDNAFWKSLGACVTD